MSTRTSPSARDRLVCWLTHPRVWLLGEINYRRCVVPGCGIVREVRPGWWARRRREQARRDAEALLRGAR